ncbi:MAG: CDP-paratose 2-epimerase [Planctomycetes bacterium]|nr:CDP-paratose 2-epimerase [Planctomycetota bacterium]
MTQWLPVPPEELFPFFSDAHNLERITPDLLRFEVLTPKPIDMREGTLIDYRLKVRGVPLRWRTRIEQWDPPRQFVDTQIKGPYQLWHHTHRFEPKDGGTTCTDIVRYRPPGGPLMGLINKLFVQRDVEMIFRHRAEVLEDLFGAQ